MIAKLFILVGLAFALAYFLFIRREKSWSSSLVKTIPLVAFGMAGVMAGAPWLLTMGLFLSAAGDFGLSVKGDKGFLIGLAAFAIAHIAYIAHFIADSALWPWQAYLLQPVPALILTAIVLSTEVWIAPHTGEMRWPVRIYTLIIGVMGLSALMHPEHLALLGAGLFIASDLILAVDLFRLKEDAPARRFTSYSLWPFYVGGQFCLLLSGIM